MIADTVQLCPLPDSAKRSFDRVDHTIIIRKLIDLGTRSAIIPWIADFLCSRQQCVRYHSTCSDWVSLHAGVPQGTKLGPIIFQAVFNDVNPYFQNSTTFKYVDELSIVECRNCNQPSELQKSIDYLLTWCDHNYMKVNPQNVLKWLFVSYGLPKSIL